MNDRDHKVHELLRELRDGERNPPFSNLWSLAQKKVSQPRQRRLGAWRWTLGPAVAAGVVVLLLVFVIQPNIPIAPPEGRETTSNADALLASFDDLELPAGILDGMLTEPSWLSARIAE